MVTAQSQRVEVGKRAPTAGWIEGRPGPPTSQGHTVGKSIRVLIVDNHQVVVDSIAALLSGEGDMTVVGSADSVADSLLQTLAHEPDVIVMDYHLADGTGVDAAVAIQQVRPGIKLIFLSREGSDAAQIAAIEAGASAFIQKSEAAGELITAIRMAESGVSQIDPGIVGTMLRRRRDMDVRRESLTARERQVLRFMANGVPSRDIATQLGINYSTVRTHIRNLGRKLEAHSKVEIIIKARNLALVE